MSHRTSVFSEVKINLSCFCLHKCSVWVCPAHSCLLRRAGLCRLLGGWDFVFSSLDLIVKLSRRASCRCFPLGIDLMQGRCGMGSSVHVARCGSSQKTGHAKGARGPCSPWSVALSCASLPHSEVCCMNLKGLPILCWPWLSWTNRVAYVCDVSGCRVQLWPSAGMSVHFTARAFGDCGGTYTQTSRTPSVPFLSSRGWPEKVQLLGQRGWEHCMPWEVFQWNGCGEEGNLDTLSRFLQLMCSWVTLWLLGHRRHCFSVPCLGRPFLSM